MPIHSLTTGLPQAPPCLKARAANGGKRSSTVAKPHTTTLRRAPPLRAVGVSLPGCGLLLHNGPLTAGASGRATLIPHHNARVARCRDYSRDPCENGTAHIGLRVCACSPIHFFQRIGTVSSNRLHVAIRKVLWHRYCFKHPFGLHAHRRPSRYGGNGNG